jgi:hypothetical protein
VKRGSRMIHSERGASGEGSHCVFL